METQRFKVDARAPEPELIARAAAILRGGGLVAFPTETVYGLGANALNEAAVEKIFAAKERPRWDPLIVHISGAEMLSEVAADVPAKFEKLAARFMPGPMTLLLPRSSNVPLMVTAGREKVAVRMPRHPVAQALIRAAGVPIAAPSANRFSRPSPTLAEHVMQDLGGRIDAVLDAGPCEVGVESTILDITQWPPVLLRRGGLTREVIEEALGCRLEIYSPPPADKYAKDEPPESLPAPGAGIRHYAPRARLVLAGPSESELASAIGECGGENKLGVMLPSRWHAQRGITFDWGTWGTWEQQAARLFAGLRWLDAQGVDVIIAPLPPEEGLASAIRERLMKAAR